MGRHKTGRGWCDCLSRALLVLCLFVLGSPAAFGERRELQLAGAQLELDDVSGEVEVYFRSLRFNRAEEIFNVEVMITNRSSEVVHGPVVMVFDSFTGTSGPLNPDGNDDSSPPRAAFDLSSWLPGPSLRPGEGTEPRTLSLGQGSGVVSLDVKVFGRLNPVVASAGLVRTLSSVGHPLPEVEVAEEGPFGVQDLRVDDPLGLVTLGQGEGKHTWRFSRAGYLPVWREVELEEGVVRRIVNPRLTERSMLQEQVTPLNGGSISNEDVSIGFAPGQVPRPGLATLTALSPQSLPGMLPLGWSPLQSFWLELEYDLASPVDASVALEDVLRQGETGALVIWDAAALAWRVARVVTGDGTRDVTVPLGQSGAYSLVVGDEAPAPVPPAPVEGELLSGSAGIEPGAAELSAGGRVEPSSSPASSIPELVTAAATVVITNAGGALSSGMPLRGDVTETYALRDGSLRRLPRYDTFIIGYQRPGDGDAATLHAEFPLRPLLLYGAEELDEAVMKVDVLAPGEFGGSLIGPEGGQVVEGDLRILAGAGAVERFQAVELRELDRQLFQGLAGGLSNVVAAFEVNVGDIAEGQRLETRFEEVEPDRLYVLARVLSEFGVAGLEPVERLASNQDGLLRSMEPEGGERLPGITGSGQFVLVEVEGAQGMIRGIARDAEGAPAEGLEVRVLGQPWLTFSRIGGHYRIIAPEGEGQVVVADMFSGDSGQYAVTVGDPGSVLELDVEAIASGPRVAAVSPLPDAENVARVSSVEVSFSEPIAAASLGASGVALFDEENELVKGSLSLNLRGTVATFLPSGNLAPRARYTIVVSSEIADEGGLPLEGENQFSFTTASDALNRIGGQVVIYEPGATNVPPELLSLVPGYDPVVDEGGIVVWGTPGSADPEAPVILVNESSGETSTVLSRPDGSFVGLIHGGEDDFVSATLVNENGTRNYLPVSRQEFDNGFVGLYEGGGILEAESDGGEVQVLVEPGSIESRSKFKVDFLTLDMIHQLTGGVEPEHAKLLGKGANIVKEGGAVEAPLDVSFSIDPSEVDMVEGMEQPEDGVFALCAVTEVEGETAYLFLDGMSYSDGRLVSSSPPDIQVTLHELETAWEANAKNMAMRAGAGFVVLATGQTLVEVAAHVPEPSGALMQFSVVAMQMQISRKVRVTGKVIACDVQSTLSCDPRILPGLPGAVVTLRHNQSLSGAPKGSLDKGAMFALSDSKGRYSMVVDNPALVDFFGTLEDDEGLAIVTATHPRYFGQRATAPVFMVATAPFAVSDLAFYYDSQNGENGSPPYVSVSHTPANPAPDETVEVTVLANHGSSVPSMEDPGVERVISLAPNVEVSSEDVEIHFIRQEEGASSVSKVYEVTSAFASRVILKVEAGAENGRSRRLLYPITFGGPDTDLPEHLEQIDYNDKTGPTVVRTLPAEQTAAQPLGVPIQIQFSEPIQRDVEQDASAIQLDADGSSPTWQLSGDQQTLTVHTTRLLPNQEYTVTITPSIRDLAGNPLDQDPSTPASDSFTFSFATAPARKGSFPGLNLGGGVVLQGNYAYALDRGNDQQNGLVVFSLTDPAAPVEVGRVRFPGRPRDLAMIRDYSYKTHPENGVVTNNLIAVIGGDVAPLLDNEGNIAFSGQYLRLYSLADPEKPEVLVSKQISIGRISAATKIVWEQPLLAYLESGAESQQIGLINLQSFIIGAHLTQEEFLELPVDPTPGKDANGDGDYVDEGDELPFPARLPFEFAGKVSAVTMEDTTQRILDFDLDTRVGHLSVSLGKGKKINVHGAVTDESLAPAFRVVMDTGSFLPNESQAEASFLFPGERPKRVSTFFGVRIEQTNEVRLANVALVSVHGGGGSKVAVLDITNPLEIELLTEIGVDPQLGLAQSVTVGEEGFLHLATSNHRILIDPTRLGMTAEDPLKHPAVVGVIPAAGTGNMTTDSSLSGLYAVNLGGESRVVQTSPFLRFGSLPDYEGVLNPQDITDNREALEELLRKFNPVASLFPARFRTAGGAESSLSPPKPGGHYYVMVLAPGSAGESIDLALESLNERGYPLRNKGLAYAPVRAMSGDAVLALGQAPRAECDAPMQALPAYRLSNDRGSRFYNYYLSRPFALTYEAMSAAELNELQEEMPREILWSGHYLRATLDPRMEENAVLGSFASRIDEGEKVTRPGAYTVAETLPGDYIMGPNPPHPRGFMELPGTFGTVSAHNGEFRSETTDLFLPSRRFGIELVRHIGGQDLYDGPFGRGWDFNFNQRLVELHGGLFPPGSEYPLILRGGSGDLVGRSKDVLFYNGRGRTLLFRYHGEEPPAEFAQDPLAEELGWFENATGFYLPSEGVFDLLVRFPSGEFARLTPEGRQYWYSAHGRVTKAHDKYPDNEIRVEYNSRGELIRVVDKSVMADRFLEFGYYRAANDPLFDSSLDEESSDTYIIGKIARVQDYSGREIEYFYDECGRMERKEGPEITVAGEGGFLGKPSIRYVYSNGASANGIRGVVAGSETGNPLFVSEMDDPDPGSPVVETGTGAGGDVSVAMTHANRAEAVAQGGSKTSVSLPGGLSSEVVLNKLALPKDVTVQQGEGSATRSYEFYDNGLIKKVTHPEGNSTEYLYQDDAVTLRSRGNLIRIVHNPGPRGGDVLEAQYPVEDLRYNVPSGTGRHFSGATLEFEVTPSGRDVEEIRFGSDASIAFTYNNYGQVLTETDERGIVTVHGYTAVNGFRSSSSRGPVNYEYGYSGAAGSRGLATRVTPPQGVATEMTYDERGKMVTRTRAGGYGEEYSYNENGKLIRFSESLGDGHPMVVEMDYRQNGFMDSMTFMGLETGGFLEDLTFQYEPDELFRVKKIIHPGGEEQTFEEYNVFGKPRVMRFDEYGEEYSYDANGNLKSATGEGGGANQYVYDGHNRLLSITSPTGDVFERTYYGDGSLKSYKVTDANGALNEETAYERDAFGRVKKITRTGGQANRVETYSYSGLTTTRTIEGGDSVTFTSDGAGRPAGVKDSIQDLTYSYDGFAVTEVSAVEVDTYTTRFTPINSYGFSEGLADDVGVIAGYDVRHDGQITALRNSLGKTTELPKSRLGEALELGKPNGVKLTFEYDPSRKLSKIYDRLNKGRSAGYNGDQLISAVDFRDGNSSEFAYASGAVESVAIPGGTIQYSLDEQGRAKEVHINFAGDVRDEAYTYDALDRVVSASFPNGTSTYTIDPLGPVTHMETTLGSETLTTSASLRADGFRTGMVYPSGEEVSLPRDAAGRLSGVTAGDGGAVIASRSFAAASLLGEESLGEGVIQRVNEYDLRKRPLRIAYKRAGDDEILSEVRYQYDEVDNQTVRQWVHRLGRADLFKYDAGYRLTEVHSGARPGHGFLQALRLFPGFSSGEFKPGFHARNYTYDGGGLDVLVTYTTTDPDNLGAGAFVDVPGNPDSLAKDQLGNLSLSPVWILGEGAGAVGSVMQLDLRYDGKGNLIRIVRPDGLEIELGYNEKNLAVYRKVTRPGGAVEERIMVYDGMLLIEDYELEEAGRSLMARYYYSDDDVPVAADLMDGTGELRRYYFLTDALGSVMALADAEGEVLERYFYDAFGQPEIEPADRERPRIRRIVSGEGGSLLVEFSERVLPPLEYTEGTELLTEMGSLAGSITLSYELGGEERSDEGAPTYVEVLEGFPFGTVVRFLPEFPIPEQGITVGLEAGRLSDEWGNVNEAESVAINYVAAAGSVLYLDDNVGETGPGRAARSIAGSAVLFHGQHYDYDSGLYYLRARHYNPYTGLFLQRDPLGYEDGPNLYAAFGHNPINNRDPLGLSIARVAGSLASKAGRALRSAKGIRGTPASRVKARLNALNIRGMSGDELKGIMGLRASGSLDETLGVGRQAGLTIPDEAVGIEATFKMGGRDVDFIGQGGNYYIFKDLETGRGLRVRKGAHLDDATFEGTVRGHQVWDELGLMKFYGGHRRGEFPLKNGQILDREVFEIELFRGFRDRELTIDADGYNGSVYGARRLTKRQQRRAERMNAYHRKIERIATREVDHDGFAKDFGGRFEILGEGVDQFGTDYLGRIRFPDPPVMEAGEFSAIMNAIRQFPRPF